MAVDQRGSGAEYVFGFLEDMLDRYYLPRQRGGNAASRRARAQAELLADLRGLARAGRAEVEGAGE